MAIDSLFYKVSGVGLLKLSVGKENGIAGKTPHKMQGNNQRAGDSVVYLR